MAILRERYQNPKSDINQSEDIITSALLYKYAIGAGVIVLIVFVWVLGGYLHARERVKAGKKPLFYHKFFIHSTEQRQYSNTVTYLSSYGRAGTSPYELRVWRRAEDDDGDRPPDYSHDIIPPAYQAAHKDNSNEDLTDVPGEPSRSAETATEHAPTHQEVLDEEDVERPARIYTAAGPVLSSKQVSNQEDTEGSARMQHAENITENADAPAPTSDAEDIERPARIYTAGSVPTPHLSTPPS